MASLVLRMQSAASVPVVWMGAPVPPHTTVADEERASRFFWHERTRAQRHLTIARHLNWAARQEMDLLERQQSNLASAPGRVARVFSYVDVADLIGHGRAMSWWGEWCCDASGGPRTHPVANVTNALWQGILGRVLGRGCGG